MRLKLSLTIARLTILTKALGLNSLFENKCDPNINHFFHHRFFRIAKRQISRKS